MIYIYEDESLLNEVSRDLNGNYSISLGPQLGYDGTNGEMDFGSFWLANKTGIALSSVVLTVIEARDDGNTTLSLDGNQYFGGSLDFGSMNQDEAKMFTIKVDIVPLTPQGRKTLSFKIEAQD